MYDYGFLISFRFSPVLRMYFQIYYYVPESEPSTEHGSMTVYNRYVLKTGKKFENTFFPEKDEVLQSTKSCGRCR